MTDDIFDDDEQPVIMGYSTKCTTMADGSLRVQIDINPADAQKAFKMLGTPNSAVALARLTDETANEANKPKAAKGPYGEWAKKLVQSGFFRTPKVWEAIGTDEEFLAWVKRQKSAKSGDYSERHDDGEKYCIPAHVRHLEIGGGTGIKPKYAAIPLTNAEHQLGHQQGDSAIGPRDWWDKMRVKYVSQWAYETLKARMNYDSYTDMPPHRLLAWARQRDLDSLLPMAYNDLEDEDGETTESQAEGKA